MPNATLERGSFRDRHGRIYYADGRVFRGISGVAEKNWQKLKQTRFYQNATKKGLIVPTEETSELAAENLTDTASTWSTVLEHQRIPVVSYPYEWSFGMLKDAALLHLRLLAAALNEGMILKDSTSFNIQYMDGQPVFIDIPSFEILEKGESWVGYRQFCQLFLFPLMIQAYKNMHFQPLIRGSIDGINPEVADAMFSFRDRFRKGVFTHAYLQAKLLRKYSGTSDNVRGDLKSAGFNLELIKHNVAALKKLVSRLEWRPEGSEWGDYTNFHNYSESDHAKKEQIIEETASELKPDIAWDVGCNTGQFSLIAARHAKQVVAMDADHLAVEKLYRHIKQDNVKNILPLVMNLADPSPNLGWRGQERTDLASRAKPDLVLCLALIHHVVISANIPVSEFIQWLASLDANLVIEFVTKNDDKVKALLRNKADQYDDYELDYFEQCLNQHFRVDQRWEMDSGNRFMYRCSPLTGAES